MAFPFAAIGLGLSAISTGMGIFGAAKQDSAADRAAAAQYKYNVKSWKMGKQRLRAERQEAVRNIRRQAKNEFDLARFKDKTNFRDYKQALKIREFEYQSQMRQYRKSEELFQQQTTFNKQAQIAANEAEFRRLQDATNEIAYQNQDLVIKAMESEGVAAVKGQSGRSARKGGDQIFASLGRNQAILADSLLSAQAETDAAIKKIANDRFGADIAAQAQRMLQPRRNPKPQKPLMTPVAKYELPRQLSNFDFGPRPVKGAAASSLPGTIASGIGSLASSIAGMANQNPPSNNIIEQPSTGPAPGAWTQFTNP